MLELGITPLFGEWLGKTSDDMAFEQRLAKRRPDLGLSRRGNFRK